MNQPAQKQWTEAEFRQLLLIVHNIHHSINSIPEGGRKLLEVHGFSPWRLQATKRCTYKLSKALRGVVGDAS